MSHKFKEVTSFLEKKKCKMPFFLGINRGYYTVARRYEFYFRVAKKYCFCNEKIKFISSSRRVMFFLLYRQNYIEIIEGNYKLTLKLQINAEISCQN